MADDKEYFSIGDARTGISPEQALKLGKGFGSRFKHIAVVTDKSYFSPVLADAFIAGAVSAGADIRYGGVVPAPVACSYFFIKCEVVVVVHGVMDRLRNSGISFYGITGVELTDKEVNKRSPRPMPDAFNVGKVVEDNNAIQYYLDRFKTICTRPLGYAVLDCGHNSTSFIAPRALEDSGASIISMETSHGKLLPRGFEVEKKDVLSIAQIIQRSTGAIGILYNGDGTRFALLNEAGDYVSNDFLLCLILMYYEPETVVIPFDAPLCVEFALDEPLNILKKPVERGSKKPTVYRVKNDRIAIIEAMRAHNADFGALLDGTFFFSQNGYCPDAIFGSAIILQLARDRSIRNILSKFRTYHRKSLTVQAKVNKPLRMLSDLKDRLGVRGIEFEELSDDSLRVIYGKKDQCIVTPVDVDEGTWNIYGEAHDALYLQTMIYSLSDMIESIQ